jgi:hypothetical protein
MRFSLTMEDSLVEQIDEEARQTGTTRAEWIRQACTDALTTEAPGPTPEEHQAHQVEVIELRTRTAYQERTIADLTADREISPGRDRPVTTGDRPTRTGEQPTHSPASPAPGRRRGLPDPAWWSGSGEQ